MSEPLPTAELSSLPPKPPGPPQEIEDSSPPRKRPRTQAYPRPATSTAPTDVSNATSKPPPEDSQTPISRFSIQPVNRFRGASASIKRPREVAHFSYDDNHEYRADDSSINYYVPPPMGVDLKEGFDTFRHYEDKEDPHLDSLLKALSDKEKGDEDRKKITADFMTWRGMMTKVS